MQLQAQQYQQMTITNMVKSEVSKQVATEFARNASASQIFAAYACFLLVTIFTVLLGVHMNYPEIKLSY